MKVYTRTGDQGNTSLISGERVPKYDERIEAYGTLDELSAFIACLHDRIGERKEHETTLSGIQQELRAVLDRLMVAQALLASTDTVRKKLPQLVSEDTKQLEEAIDRMTEQLPVVNRFTLPCGDSLVSLSHVCRTICRRAERKILFSSQKNFVPEEVVHYVNRLSDYLYVLGRFVGQVVGAKEIYWEPTQRI